ncbi:MAG: cupin domain-containing protein [Gammaproteobacteria bacterium]
MKIRLLHLVLGCALLACQPAWSADVARKIVLVGGVPSEGPGRHDYPNGTRLLKSLLESSAELRAIENLTVEAHTDGWPSDPSAFDDAATIVLYCDGLENHPLFDPGRRAVFQSLMQRGVGLVALHQAVTVPAGDVAIGLERWLGGARYGMYDRTTEMAELTPAGHAVGRGVAPFAYYDEFYPTIRFERGAGKLTPLLTGALHVQFREGRHLVIGAPVTTTVAWAFEREAGGRAVGFSGAHYLMAFDVPELRRLLLNAVIWTAGLEVPEDGVHSEPADAAARIVEDLGRKRVVEAVVTRPADDKIVQFPWGQLTWYASGELGNSDTMTVGRAVIRPGLENPRHFHPNCDEVLHVLQGRILHSMGDRKVEMAAGDTVSIATGVPHNARNIGDQDAVLLISFSSADRKVVNE